MMSLPAQGVRNRSDSRVVYGAHCQWWGLIEEAGRKHDGIPCCPVCGSVLMEVPDEKTWWRGVDAYTKITNYRGFVEWLKGRCYTSLADALADWRDDEAEVGAEGLDELAAKVEEARKDEAAMDRLDRQWRVSLSCGHEYLNVTTIGDFDYMAVRGEEQIACPECNKNVDKRSTNRVMAVAVSAVLLSEEENVLITINPEPEHDDGNQ